MQKIRTFLMAGIISILSVIPSFAATNTNPNQVVIELEANQNKAGGTYQPGEEAGYQLTLKNKLGDAWVRVKFTLSEEHIDKPFTDDALGMTGNWVKRGGYWYYTKKANAYTDYLVVDGVKIPDVNVANQDAYVRVEADADAVQYSALNPDFSKDEPWKDAEIVSKSHSSGGHDSSGRVSSSIYMYSSPQESGSVSTGKWELVNAENHEWKYTDGHGNYAKSGWIYVRNPYTQTGDEYAWFHFGDDALMTYGWYKTPEQVWYYTHGISDGNLGMLIRGWHHDGDDDKWYFLDRITGIMLSGWQEIDGNSYYFTKTDETAMQTWYYRLLGESRIGKWVYEKIGYKSYGSMYVSETTPDGQRVNEKGVLTK